MSRPRIPLAPYAPPPALPGAGATLGGCLRAEPHPAPRGRPDLTSWAILHVPTGRVVGYALSPADALAALEALAPCAPWAKVTAAGLRPLEAARVHEALAATGALAPDDWRRWLARALDPVEAA